MFDELWSEINDSQGEIYDVIDFKEEWEKEEKFDVESYINGNHRLLILRAAASLQLGKWHKPPCAALHSAQYYVHQSRKGIFQMTNLNQFFADCLNLPYKGNSQDNPEHENQVAELLEKYNLKYEFQPNGIQNSPDFRVHHEGKTYDVECKSSKQAFPTYNGGLPKKGVIYIFSSKKYNETTIFFADDVVSEKKREMYSKLTEELNTILKMYQMDDEWKEDERGFDFYIRNMYTQSGGKDKTDYFTHSSRNQCEQNVINYAF